MRSNFLQEMLTAISEPEVWTDEKAARLSGRFADKLNEVDPAVIRWADRMGMLPLEAEDAFDKAFERENIKELEQAVEASGREWARIGEEEARSRFVLDAAKAGTLQGIHVLPVALKWQGVLGKRIIVVKNTEAAAAEYQRRPGEEMIFHQAEFVELIQAIQRGEDATGWLSAKRMFKGITVTSEQIEFLREG